MAATASLSDLLPRFLRRCDADSTRLAYDWELRRFLAWLPDPAGAEVLFDYRDALRARGLGPTTIQWRTIVARAFLKFAREQGEGDAPAVGDFKPPRGTTGFAPRVLTKQQLTTLITAPDRRSHRGKRDALVLVFMGVGGLRAGEVCRLDRADAQIGRGTVALRVYGKGRKQRLVALPGSWAAPLKTYLTAWPERESTSEPLFWSGQPGHETRRLTVAAVDYIVRGHARTTGLPSVSAHRPASHRRFARDRCRGAAPSPTGQARALLGAGDVKVSACRRASRCLSGRFNTITIRLSVCPCLRPCGRRGGGTRGDGFAACCWREQRPEMPARSSSLTMARHAMLNRP
jgi:integrase